MRKYKTITVKIESWEYLNNLSKETGIPITTLVDKLIQKNKEK